MHDDIDPSRRFTLTIERSIKAGASPELVPVLSVPIHLHDVGTEYLAPDGEPKPEGVFWRISLI
jgi:hypothetical protein